MDPAGFYCIGDEDTVRGFRGVGVPGEVAATPAAAARAIAMACARPGPAIIILTEPVADLLRAEVDAWRLDPARPLIAEIPGPPAPTAAPPRLRGQVQAAAGINLDWKEPGP